MQYTINISDENIGIVDNDGNEVNTQAEFTELSVKQHKKKGNGVQSSYSKFEIFGGVLFVISFIGLLWVFIDTPMEQIDSVYWIGIAGYLYILIFFKTLSREKYDIRYNLSGDIGEQYLKLCEGFGSFGSDRIWEITSNKSVKDKKYSGGATSTISRTTNVNITLKQINYMIDKKKYPFVSCAQGDFVFFPDRIIRKKASKYFEYKYIDLITFYSDTTFHESEFVAKDAKVIGKTWQYVNKRGGPDKRFSSNKTIPICKYSTWKFEIRNTDIKANFMFSNSEAPGPIEMGFLYYKICINKFID